MGCVTLGPMLACSSSRAEECPRLHAQVEAADGALPLADILGIQQLQGVPG